MPAISARRVSPREAVRINLSNVIGKIFSVPTVRLESTLTIQRAIKKDEKPDAKGGFGHIFKVLIPWRGVAAVKRAIFTRQNEDLERKIFLREIGQLPTFNHPNIVRFLCSFHDIPGFGSGMVLGWAENGSLTSYLAANEDADRLSLMIDVARALEYLHTREPPVVHGDLCCDNVLVSETGNALLTDFGLSGRVSGEDEPISDFKYMPAHPRYNAPELFGADEATPRTPATDVFAFGMVVVEAYTSKHPFPHLGNMAVPVAIDKGERPQRAEITRADFPEELWQLLEECWDADHRKRPTMSLVRERLDELARRHGPTQ